ncbi:hypothetical protein GBF35_00385 [Nonomuraea phyllanthi]|uniref:hypothetical protein n=1 Tax=Nonomuraea phyllanthi TaxID=2219224 RepID=UPI001293CC05|nr:hypothetical protein [Nonomuraea phyllanthi]QFY05344.1 hypothetical protein GBF35_00385 [Nonomuraea phyllanthi]
MITINTTAGAVAENHSYQLRTPVLIIRFGTTHVQIATAQADRVTAAEVEFARQLAREANDFARSVERTFRGQRKAQRPVA